MDAVPFRYLAQEYSLPNRSLPGWTLFLPVNLLPGTSFCAAFALTKSRVQGAAGDIWQLPLAPCFSESAAV